LLALPLPLPKVKPIKLASGPVWTLALSRLVVSPGPMMAKVSPFTPAAVRLLPK